MLQFFIFPIHKQLIVEISLFNHPFESNSPHYLLQNKPEFKILSCSSKFLAKCKALEPCPGRKPAPKPFRLCQRFLAPVLRTPSLWLFSSLLLWWRMCLSLKFKALLSVIRTSGLIFSIQQAPKCLSALLLKSPV